MKCKACGAPIPDGALFCVRCGIHVETGARADGDAPDSTVYPLLAAANLYRMRGDWNGAEQKCVEVLRQYPNNATAHSLLGDIYANQGRWEEAVQWYQLACDLDPGNQGDRAKLEQARLSGAGAAPDAAEPDADASGPAKRAPRLSPVVQLVGFALLTCVVVLLAMNLMRSREPKPLAGSQSTTYPGSEFEPALRPSPAVPPNSAAAEAAAAPVNGSVPAPAANNTAPPAQPVANPSAPAGNAPPAAPAQDPQAPANPPLQAPSADMTENEARTLARVRAQMPVISASAQARITDVRWDPLYQRAIVTILFAQRLSREALMDEALRSAYRVGQMLHNLDARYFARAEILIKAPIAGSTGPDLVFAAEAAPNPGANAWAEDSLTASPQALLPAFQNAWWHPRLR